MQRALGKETEIGILGLDAHGDMGTPETMSSFLIFWENPYRQVPKVVTRNLKMVLDTGRVRAFSLTNTHFDFENPSKEKLIYHVIRILGECLEIRKEYSSFEK